MLRAIPRSLFSWGFSILEDDVEVAGLEVSWMRERGTLDIKGQNTIYTAKAGSAGFSYLKARGLFLLKRISPMPLLVVSR